MKNLITGAGVWAIAMMFAVVSTSNAAVVLVEDFEGYSAGSSIHNQGGWVEQRNSPLVGPHGGARAAMSRVPVLPAESMV